MASSTGASAAWACSGRAGREGLDGLRQGLGAEAVGGALDGLEHGCQRRLGLLGPGRQGLDGLRQGLELIGVGGALDGLQHGCQRRLGLLGESLGARAWTACARAWSSKRSVVPLMASSTGASAAWACSGPSLGARAWTACARAWS